MKTRAAVLVEIGKPLAIKELDIPPLQEGQCLVRIMSAGICATQLNEQAGTKGDDPYIPHLLGHEGAGFVEEIGKGVEKVRKGAYVVVSWIKGVGADVGGGKYTAEDGAVIQSGGAAVFTEYAVVSENRLVPISEKVPSDVASLFGCAIPTGAGVVFNTLALKKAQSVVVFGVGGVGGAAILAAKQRGCDPIIAIDVVDEKLKLAKKLGATDVLLNNSSDIVAKVHAVVPGGVDAAIEATGIARVGETALSALHRRGRLVIAGHPAVGTKMCIDPFMLIEGRSISGTWGGDGNIDQDISMYTDLYLDGSFQVDNLITHRFKLSEVNQAFDAARSGVAGRIVLTIGS